MPHVPRSLLAFHPLVLKAFRPPEPFRSDDPHSIVEVRLVRATQSYSLAYSRMWQPQVILAELLRILILLSFGLIIPAKSLGGSFGSYCRERLVDFHTFGHR